MLVPDVDQVIEEALNVTKFTKPQQKIIQDLTGEVKPISAKSGFPVGKTGVKILRKQKHIELLQVQQEYKA